MSQQVASEVSGDTEHLMVMVAGPDGSVLHFRIKRHMPLRGLMNAYCERHGFTMRFMRFRFDGDPIHENDTPAQLEMENGDTIDVFFQQTGGAW